MAAERERRQRLKCVFVENRRKKRPRAATISLSMTKRDSRGPVGGVPAAAGCDWQAVLAEHERWLRTIVYARLREPQAVDEVLQEVSLAAVRQAAPLADPAKVSPWLYRLAIRQSLLYRRRCGRFRKLTSQFAQAFPPEEHDERSPDPLAWLLAEERRVMVKTALEKLPRRDAEILLLKYTENWSYHRIAQQLGASHSAVEARLHRARARLRQELASLHVLEVQT